MKTLTKKMKLTTKKNHIPCFQDLPKVKNQCFQKVQEQIVNQNQIPKNQLWVVNRVLKVKNNLKRQNLKINKRAVQVDLQSREIMLKECLRC